MTKFYLPFIFTWEDVSYIKIRAETIRSARDTMRYDAHDTIRPAIHLPFLPGKQRLVISAWDQKHCTPPTTTACTVMMRSGYNNGGLGVSRCSVFVMNSLILLENTDFFCGISCLFLTLACVTFVPYRIVSSSECIAIRTIAFVSAIYRCVGVSFQP